MDRRASRPHSILRRNGVNADVGDVKDGSRAAAKSSWSARLRSAAICWSRAPIPRAGCGN